MPRIDLRAIGPRGLVVHKDNEFRYIREDDWRATTKLEGKKMPQWIKSHKAAVEKLEKEEGAFINLNSWNNLAKASSAPGEESIPWESTPSVVIKEGDELYQVPIDKLQVLDEGAEGDAGVVVRRGAIAANIPSNMIPSGTYCILVNLDSLI